MPTSTLHLGIFYMPQSCDMGPTALLHLRRKACWGFFCPKNPTDSAGCEPANLGTKGQHATSRPPNCYCYCYWETNSVQKPFDCIKPFFFLFHPGVSSIWHKDYLFGFVPFNPLNPELNPICYLLALLGAHNFLHFSRIRVKSLTFRLLMSYIYIYIYIYIWH